MFSRKISVVSIATTILSLALLAGCKTSETKPKPTPTPPVATPTPTNQPAPPVITNKPDSGDTMSSNILAWDAVVKEYHAKPGEMRAPFSFSMTNISPHPVMVYDTETTCECTVAKLPSKPWTVPSGGAGTIEASINLSNKVQDVTSSVVVFTSQGNRRLTLKVFLPESIAK